MEKLGPYLLGPNDENQGIYAGDARELAKAIPDESVDLIFTDPVYQNIDDYRWLAETAARVLKSHGHLLAYVTQQHLPLQLEVMGMSPLYWGWLFSIQLFGRRAAIWQKQIQACGQQIAWYSKGSFSHCGWAHDFVGAQAKRLSGHDWRKGYSETLHYLKAFSRIDDIVADFFCGGGTISESCKMLSRCWLAFEIDPDTAELARRRVAQTQPPLFVLEPEQLDFLSEQGD